MSATLLTVSTTIQLPVEECWKMYTSPQHIIYWNQASPDWHTPSAENDLTIEGKFNYRMEAKDGSVGFDFCGSFNEIIENELLVYTMDDDRKATVDFKSQGNSTIITVDFEAENENSLELQQAGWQAILNSFKNYAEKTNV